MTDSQAVGGTTGDDRSSRPPESQGEEGRLQPDAVTSSPRGVSVDGEMVNEPAKVMRLGTMIKQLLEEVRNFELDEASRGRLREIYQRSVDELGEALSPDLREELDRLSFPFESELPTEAELRVAKAQLVGWLEGLFHGIQATLFAQQMAARQQLENMRAELPRQSRPERHGTYL